MATDQEYVMSIYKQYFDFATGASKVDRAAWMVAQNRMLRERGALDGANVVYGYREVLRQATSLAA